MKNLKTNWLIKHTLTVFSCVLIIVFGIVFLSQADPVTTTIGENIATNDLSVTGNVTSGTWQGTAVETEYGGTGADWSAVAQGNLPYFSGAGTLSNLAPGTAGQFLKSQGTSADPAWANVTRSATFVVAASDSSTLSKQQADYVCDGTADDVEIQAAIDALPSGGGKVVLMEGEYSISSSVTPKTKTTLVGFGRGTVLKLANSVASGRPIIAIHSVNNVIISSMLLDGNKTNQSDLGAYLVFEGIDFSLASECLVTDMYIQNTYADGIDIDGGSDILVTNCHIANCRGSAVHISQLDPQRIMVKNIHSYYNGHGVSRPAFDVYNDAGTVGDYCIFDGCISNGDYKGFDIGGGNYNSVVNCKVLDPTTYCISVAGGNYHNISNCQFMKTNNTTIPVYFKADYSNFINNHVYTSLGPGISIEGTSVLLSNNNFITRSTTMMTQGGGLQKSLVIGNSIEHIGAMDMGRGIDLSLNSSNNTFIGNYIRKGTWTIYILSGCNNNKFTDNYLQSGGAGIVNNNGTNTKIQNNIGYITESSGTATLVNGTTSIVVTHGLDATPSAGDITVTPIEAWGAMTEFYIDTYTSTQFTIHADQDPTQDVDFAWKAIVL